MSESARSPESPAVFQANELDESIWQAWLLKNAERGRRGAARRMIAVKWTCAALLLVTTALWKYVGSFDVAIRFVLSAGALAVALQALRLRSYGFVLGFLAIAVIYNPLAAIFPASGGWPVPLVFLTFLAFMAALIRLKSEPPGVRTQPGKLPLDQTRIAAWENEGGASGGLAPGLDQQRKGAS